MDNKESIAVFGGGVLQQSIILRCKALGIQTIVLDPDENATAGKSANVFEVVGPDNFGLTSEIIKKYQVKGIVTSSTDKPLVMMARIAKEFDLPFISEETAVSCTDKFRMKQVFIENRIKCATGYLISEVEDIPNYPVIIKPLDNSGSRGVYYCAGKEDVEMHLENAKLHTKLDRLLCEEFLSGDEYSIESVHSNHDHHIVQITGKIISQLPYQVEMGHLAPALISIPMKNKIATFIEKIALAFHYNNCVAHTEIKINDGKIYAIETSPRLGGDFITSKLVPLSTGINMEDCLINLSLGREIAVRPKNNSYSGIFYFKLPVGIITQIADLEFLKEIPGVVDFTFELKEGDEIKEISNSLDRYGYVIINLKSHSEIIKLKEKIFSIINERILINKDA